MPERGFKSKCALAFRVHPQWLRRSRVCPQADEYMDEPGTPPPYQVSVLPLPRKCEATWPLPCALSLGGP